MQVIVIIPGIVIKNNKGCAVSILVDTCFGCSLLVKKGKATFLVSLLVIGIKFPCFFFVTYNMVLFTCFINRSSGDKDYIHSQGRASRQPSMCVKAKTA